MNPNENNFTFEDTQGTSWDVTLTLAGATRIQRSDFSEVTDKEFNILEPNKEMFMGLLTDTPILFAMIWALVHPKAAGKLGMTKNEGETDADFNARMEVEFMDRLNGQAIKDGREAFWKSLADFYPNQQAALLTLMNQFNKADAKINLAVKDMESMLEEALDKEIKKGTDQVRKDLARTGR